VCPWVPPTHCHKGATPLACLSVALFALPWPACELVVKLAVAIRSRMTMTPPQALAGPATGLPDELHTHKQEGGYSIPTHGPAEDSVLISL